MSGEKELEQEILTTNKLSKEELEGRVAEYMRDGYTGFDGKKRVARSRMSALNKLRRAITYEDVPGDHVARGYFLGAHTNKRRNENKIYVQLIQGDTRSIILASDIPHPENLKGGDPIEVKPVLRQKNIFLGFERWRTNENTKAVDTKLSQSFIDCCPEFQQVSRDGIYCLRGAISAVFPGKDFTGWKQGQDTRTLPRLPVIGSGDKVNLSLAVASGYDSDGNIITFSVKISTLENLTSLVGDDIDWLNTEDNVVGELNDMLRDKQVIVFGILSRTIGRGREMRETKPFMNITNLGWIKVIEDKPTQTPSSAIGSEVDEEESDSE